MDFFRSFQVLKRPKNTHFNTSDGLFRVASAQFPLKTHNLIFQPTAILILIEVGSDEVDLARIESIAPRIVARLFFRKFN